MWISREKKASNAIRSIFLFPHQPTEPFQIQQRGTYPSCGTAEEKSISPFWFRLMRTRGEEVYLKQAAPDRGDRTEKDVQHRGEIKRCFSLNTQERNQWRTLHRHREDVL